MTAPNHCRDCNSDYVTPGTCNCFAPGGKRYVAPYIWYPAPYIPWIPFYPLLGVPCLVCGKYGCTETHITWTNTTTPIIGNVWSAPTDAQYIAQGQSMSGGDTSGMVNQ